MVSYSKNYGAWMPDVSGYALRRAEASGDRRREPRYPTRDLAEVEVRHGEMLRLPATVVDVSRSGLRLELKTEVGRGEQVKINMPKQVVILGEIRYCRRSDDVFHAGVLIQDVFYPQPVEEQHLSNDELSFFLVGKGLAVADVIRLREHLIECQSCRARLGETDAVLNPERRRKS